VGQQFGGLLLKYNNFFVCLFVCGPIFLGRVKIGCQHLRKVLTNNKNVQGVNTLKYVSFPNL
jgi:hypothetical protein